MQTQDVIKLLDEVLSGLDKAAKVVAETPGRTGAPGTAASEARLADAIDREINAPGRQTSIVNCATARQPSDSAGNWRPRA